MNKPAEVQKLLRDLQDKIGVIEGQLVPLVCALSDMWTDVGRIDSLLRSGLSAEDARRELANHNEVVTNREEEPGSPRAEFAKMLERYRGRWAEIRKSKARR